MGNQFHRSDVPELKLSLKLRKLTLDAKITDSKEKIADLQDKHAEKKQQYNNRLRRSVSSKLMDSLSASTCMALAALAALVLLVIKLVNARRKVSFIFSILRLLSDLLVLRHLSWISSQQSDLLVSSVPILAR